MGNGRDSSEVSVRAKRSLGLEGWAWIFLYMNLLIVFGGLRMRGGGTGPVDPMAFQRISCVTIAGVLAVMALLLNPTAISALFRGKLALIFLFSMVALGSSMYASHPLYSMWKGLELVIDVLVMGLFLSSKERGSSIVYVYNLTLLLIGLTMVSVWFGAIIAPHQAFVHEKGLIPVRLQGVLPMLNSNSVGSFSAITGFVCLVRWLEKSKRRWLYGLIFVGAFVTLVLSTSRTGMAAFFVGLFVYSMFSKKTVLASSIVGAIVILGLVGPVQEIGVRWFRKEQATSTLETMSGRTEAWKAAMEKFSESPLVGHGFASTSRYDLLGGQTASTLHGAVFDILAGVGLMGAIPWGLAILWTGWVLWARRSQAKLFGETWGRAGWGPELFGLYMLLMVRTVTSSGLANHEKEMMLFLCLLAAASWRPSVV